MKTLCLAMLLLLFVPVTFPAQEAFASMLAKARQGDVSAQSDTGFSYLFGEGVRQNRKKAFYWLSKAADQGYPFGACGLGHYYGRGAKRDHALMMKWVFIGQTLDPLRCEAIHIKVYKPSECQIAEGLELAVAWLKAHPEYKNNFGEQPWMKDDIGKFEEERRKKCRQVRGSS